MKIGVYYVESDNVNSEQIIKDNHEIVAKIAKKAKLDLEFCDLKDVKKYDFVLDFIGGGGTEGDFKKVLGKLPKPIFLLTSGANNSLAASMEILSYLKQNKIKGEIIHGSIDYMAKRIATLAKVFATKKKMSNFKIGRVGKPSDWLIASGVDAKTSKKINGIEIVDIPIDELLIEIKKHKYTENKYTEMIMKKKFDEKEKTKALCIYGALKRICEKYKLQGVTVRCFDLLKPCKSTGCSALAILNAEGIYASCEGDTPSLISMAILGELTGQDVFQCNPSKILTDSNEIVLAHCTLPITMPTDFKLMTHFESGIGVAFRGHLKEGPATIFKTDGLMKEHFVSKCKIENNLTQSDLCRTQITLKLEKDVNYFLTESIANHHLVILGNHEDIIEEYFKW